MTKETELSEKDKTKAQEWLQEKWTRAECSVCGLNSWSIGSHLVTPVILRGGGSVLGGPTYPQFMAICGNCGHTVYFNAIIAGVVPKVDDEKEGKK